MDKKFIYIIIGLQIVSTLLIVYTVSKNKTTQKANPSSSSDALLNSLSARLGQVQLDLNQIKAKIGQQETIKR